MKDRVIVKVPFSGFYNSIWSEELDEVEQREAEYFADERQSSEGIPEDLHLDECEVSEILYRCADYSSAHNAIARAYVDLFNEVFSDKVYPGLNLDFESMSSPREYNFTTDRVFAWADLDAIRELFVTIDKKAMDEVARERHQSRSGFISFYSPDWETWGPVDEWDYNQYETLIRAAIRATGEEADDWDSELHEFMTEPVYEAWSDCVDWALFDELCEEARDEKRAELMEEDPDYAPPPVRCKYTMEMFPATL